MDKSKRTDDSTEKFLVFEVNYDGVFIELPLRYDYGKVLSLKLTNSNRMSYSQMLDMLERISVDFLHADCVDDHFDPFDYWNYKDVYFIGCFDFGDDWIDEHVGYDDLSLPTISKDEFSKEIVLDDGGSFSVTSLSFLLKRKGKIRVKFIRKREILNKAKKLSLRKSVWGHNVKVGVLNINVGRSNYESLVTLIGLNQEVGDDEQLLATQLSHTGGSSNNDFKGFSFLLPTRITEDIEQVRRGFLWCHGEMKKGKAKMAWNIVCLPKQEHSLVLFQMLLWMVRGYGLKLDLNGNRHPFSTHVVWNVLKPRGLVISIIARLVLGATTYFIWKERNLRIFKNQSRTISQVDDIILHNVRLKLLTLNFKNTWKVRLILAIWNVTGKSADEASYIT
nr:RNA-directed DNA polymerase, eukaryota, reverse transcriptase zinc-binding domain protein [Tanacetum cinerariifolium]